MQPRSRYATCAGYEIHFMEWGAPDAPVVVAWHGLARTGRDMDPLAQHLADRYRIICPDTLGRGLSQWARHPAEEYRLRFYARIAADLFSQLGIDRAHWIGTSMGGSIGTVSASGLFEPALQGAIRSLLLNDNAPQLADAALERIKSYAGQPPAFDTVAELEAFFRQVYAPYGWLSDAQWRLLTESSTRRLADGRVTPPRPAMVLHSHTTITYWTTRRAAPARAVPARRRFRPGVAGNHSAMPPPPLAMTRRRLPPPPPL